MIYLVNYPLDTSKESVFCCLRAMCSVIVNKVNWIDRVIQAFHVLLSFCLFDLFIIESGMKNFCVLSV